MGNKIYGGYNYITLGNSIIIEAVAMKNKMLSTSLSEDRHSKLYVLKTNKSSVRFRI
jgi:hypothetical protein